MTVLASIFGFGRNMVTRGAIGVIDCPNCEHKSQYNLIKHRPRIMLFAVPIPLSVSEYHSLVCAECGGEITVDAECVSLAKDSVSRFRQYRNGQATQSDYEQTVFELFNRLGADLRPNPSGAQATEENPNLGSA